MLQEALEMGVLYGTGRKAWVPGYRVGGRTGTAEKINPENGQRWQGRCIVSFIGAAPINDPEVMIYSVVDEPNRGTIRPRADILISCPERSSWKSCRISIFL